MNLANRHRRGIVTPSVLLGIALCYSLLILGASGRKLTQSKQDQSTPEQTLKAFIDALDRKDPELALKEVKGAKVTPELKKILPLFKQFPGITLTASTSSITGDQARVKCEWHFTPEPNRNYRDEVLLERTADGWRITVPKSLPSGESISSLAYFFCNPNGINDSRKAAEKTTCLSNLKQVGLAMLIASGDKGSKFDFGSTTLKSIVVKVVHTDKVLRCPEDPPGTISYSFNSALLGFPESKLVAPTATIMVYEGSGGKLKFRHGGRAMICLTDGHAKSITAADLKNYTWNPSKAPHP